MRRSVDPDEWGVTTTKIGYQGGSSDATERAVAGDRVLGGGAREVGKALGNSGMKLG